MSLSSLSARLASTPCSPLYRSHISPDCALGALIGWARINSVGDGAPMARSRS